MPIWHAYLCRSLNIIKRLFDRIITIINETTSKLLFTSSVNIIIDGIYSCFCHNNYIELFLRYYINRNFFSPKNGTISKLMQVHKERFSATCRLYKNPLFKRNIHKSQLVHLKTTLMDVFVPFHYFQLWSVICVGAKAVFSTTHVSCRFCLVKKLGFWNEMTGQKLILLFENSISEGLCEILLSFLNVKDRFKFALKRSYFLNEVL